MEDQQLLCLLVDVFRCAKTLLRTLVGFVTVTDTDARENPAQGRKAVQPELSHGCQMP